MGCGQMDAGEVQAKQKTLKLPGLTAAPSALPLPAPQPLLLLSVSFMAAHI